MSKIHVWIKFCVEKRDGSKVDLRIQDCPGHLFQDVIQFYAKYFFSGETIHMSTGIHKRKDAIEEMKVLFTEAMQKTGIHIAVCCLDSDPLVAPTILGASAMKLKTKIDTEQYDKIIENLKAPELQKYFGLEVLLESTFDSVMTIVNPTATILKPYYAGRGIAVHPDYRKIGIATELVKARRLICKEHGVEITGAWMTSIGTQKASEKDGWDTVLEISFDDIAKHHQLTFEHKPPPMCKLVVTKVRY